MQIVSSEFKDVIKRNAVFSDGFFVISNNDDYYETFESSDFMSMEIQATAFQNKRMFGNIAQTALTLELLGDMTATIPFQDELVVTPSIGIQHDSGDHEYVSYQNFNVSEFSYNPDTNITRIVATDDLVKLNKPYTGTTEYPTTLKGYLGHVLEFCGITFNEEITFLNEDFDIEEAPFNEGTSCREIIVRILELSLSNMMIDRATNQATLINPFTDLSVVQDELDTNTYFKLQLLENNFKEHGINTLVLALENIDGENNTKQNDTNVGIDGAIEVVINDNDFIDSEALRLSVIDEMFDVVDGFKYTPYTIEYRGFPYFDIGDVIEVENTNEDILQLPIQEYFIRFDGGLFGKIKAGGVSATQTNHKFLDQNLERIKKAEIRVQKGEAIITSLTQETLENTNRLTTVEQTVEGVTTDIERIEGDIEEFANIKTTVEGIDIRIGKVGGDNLIKNSSGYYNTDWIRTFGGNETEEIQSYTDSNIQRQTVAGRTIYPLQGSYEQHVTVIEGDYILTFKSKGTGYVGGDFRIFINEDSVIEGGIVIDTDSEEWVEHEYQFNVQENTIVIRIETDVDSKAHIADMLLLPGSLRQVWTPANGESVLGGVKIGRSIEITSGESNIMQRIDNDGNKIINLTTQEVVAEYTDKGLKTESIEAENAQVSKLLIKNMGNQTWITRL